MILWVHDSHDLSTKTAKSSNMHLTFVLTKTGEWMRQKWITYNLLPHFGWELVDNKLESPQLPLLRTLNLAMRIEILMQYGNANLSTKTFLVHSPATDHTFTSIPAVEIRPGHLYVHHKQNH